MPKPTGMFVTDVRIRRRFVSGYGQDGIYGSVQVTPSALLIVVLLLENSISEGGIVGLKVNAEAFQVTALAGQSRGDVVAALVGAVNGGLQDVTAVARSNGQFVISAKSPAMSPFTVEITDGPMSLLGELIDIEASVQPILSARERELLPEGDREKESIVVFTDAEVYGVDERSGMLPDIIECDNGLGGIDEFETMIVDHFKMGILNHNEVIAVRLVRGTSEN